MNLWQAFGMFRDRIPCEQTHYDDRRVVQFEFLPPRLSEYHMYGGVSVGHARKLLACEARQCVVLEDKVHSREDS